MVLEGPWLTNYQGIIFIVYTIQKHLLTKKKIGSEKFIFSKNKF